MPLGELMMNDERTRIWKILVEEIQTQKERIKAWKEMSEVPEQVRKDQVYGFQCQLRILVAFGSKAFGVKHEILESV
jgi:inorganic pyrophosphatase